MEQPGLFEIIENNQPSYLTIFSFSSVDIFIIAMFTLSSRIIL